MTATNKKSTNASKPTSKGKPSSKAAQQTESKSSPKKKESTPSIKTLASKNGRNLDLTDWDEPPKPPQSISTAKSSQTKSSLSTSVKRPLPEESAEEEEEEESDEEVEEELEPELTEKELKELRKKLENDEFSTRFSSAEVINDDNLTGIPIKVRRGTLVRISGGVPGEEGWLTEVTEIRGLKAEMKTYEMNGVKQMTDNGQEVTAAAIVYLKTSWMYSANDFRTLTPKSLYPEKVLKCLGGREMVKSNHSDWNSSEQILANLETERLFHFDDSFPTSGKTHPLTRPILKKAKSEPEPAVVPLPYYFFGDGSEVSPVPDLKPEEGNVWRGSRRDFSGTSFYRTTVEFKTEIKKQDKKRKTGVSITKQTPLTLTSHSQSETPYNPRETQRFSPLEERWFSIKDLQLGSHWYNLLDARNEQFSGLSLHLETDTDGEMIKLLELSQSTIVRGGYFGLIGNSYLVTRARILLKEEQEDAGGDRSSDSNANLAAADNRKAEVEALHEAWLEWKDQSEKRKALLEVDPDVMGLPEGFTWISPNLEALHRI